MENNKQEKVFTRECWGIVLIFCSIISLITVTFGASVLGGIGLAMQCAIVGIFGYSAYLVFGACLWLGIMLASGKRSGLPTWVKVVSVIAAVAAICAVHSFSTLRFGTENYVKQCYLAGENALAGCTVGGAVFGLLCLPLVSLKVWGGMILLAIALASGAALWFGYVKKSVKPGEKDGARVEMYDAKRPAVQNWQDEGDVATVQKEQTQAVAPIRSSGARLFCVDEEFGTPAVEQTEALTPTKIKADWSEKESLFAKKPVKAAEAVQKTEPEPKKAEEKEKQTVYSEQYRADVEKTAKRERPKMICADNSVRPTITSDFRYNNGGDYVKNGKNDQDFTKFHTKPNKEGEITPKIFRYDAFSGEYTDGSKVAKYKSNSPSVPLTRGAATPVYTEENYYAPEEPRMEDFGQREEFKHVERVEKEPIASAPSYIATFAEDTPTDEYLPFADEAEEAPAPATVAVEPRPVQKPIDKKRAKQMTIGYQRPPLSLLDLYPGVGSVAAEEIANNKATIEQTLKAFNIDAHVVKDTVGPVFTRYDVAIPHNVPSRKVLQYDQEIAMRLRAKDNVSMYVNYASGTIAVEAPNKNREKVGLSTVLMTDKYMNSKDGTLMFGMGKDVEGRDILGDITKMTHLLVAGSTGSGKSVCLSSIIISLISKYSPEELRLLLIDPKKSEFVVYDGLPHLATDEIMYTPEKAQKALKWVMNEVTRRNNLFFAKTQRGINVRNINDYNNHLEENEIRLPRLVVIIDELAELMSTAKKEIEDLIKRITAIARSAGVHMIVATQRPSTDVVTGIIKTNLPTRIAFRVTAEVDSRTILDNSGAERLLGYGDMLYRTETMDTPQRVQGCFVDSPEVQRVVEYVKNNNPCNYDPEIRRFLNAQDDANDPLVADSDGDTDRVDEKYVEALKYVIKNGQASISMIQRRCNVGYNRAGKIIEWMEQMGYVSPYDGAKARRVLITREEYEDKYGDLE